MSWLGLEEKHEVAISLGLFVVGEEAFLKVCSFCEMIRDLVLLEIQSAESLVMVRRKTYLFQGHTILDKKCYSGVQISDVLLQNKILIRLARYLGLEIS